MNAERIASFVKRISQAIHPARYEMRDTRNERCEQRGTRLDIICPLCGTHYSEAEGRACHVECPLHEHCGRLSCPYCAYEVAAPTRLTRWLSSWSRR